MYLCVRDIYILPLLLQYLEYELLQLRSFVLFCLVFISFYFLNLLCYLRNKIINLQKLLSHI